MEFKIFNLLMSNPRSHDLVVNILKKEIDNHEINTDTIIHLMKYLNGYSIMAIIKSNLEKYDLNKILFHHLTQSEKSHDKVFCGSLIHYGANINYDDGIILYTLCDRKYSVDTMETVLKLGADPNYSTVDRAYPIMKCCLNKNEEKLSLLVEYGANINCIYRIYSVIDYIDNINDPKKGIDLLLENGHIFRYMRNDFINEHGKMYLDGFNYHYPNLDMFNICVISDKIDFLTLVKTFILHIDKLPYILEMVNKYCPQFFNKIVNYYTTPYVYMTYSDIDKFGIKHYYDPEIGTKISKWIMDTNNFTNENKYKIYILHKWIQNNPNEFPDKKNMTKILLIGWSFCLDIIFGL